MLVPRITAIYIYPIKSMGAISLTAAAVEMRGLQHDRRYMLVDSNGRFLTQRTTPALGKFQLRYNPEGTGFLVDFLGDTLSIPLYLGDDSLVGEAQIWDDTVSVLHAATSVNNWFSEKLQQPVSLVYLPDESSRPLPEEHQPNPSNLMHVSLADGYPILVISEASLQQLNQKIQADEPNHPPMQMMRFRPNIVLDQLQPHQEDELRTFQLGSATLHVTKPCSRCILTTLDPTTLERGPEPLRTLNTYRKQDHNILFGANVICLTPGKIAVSH
ncbi:MAG: MOSC domain-containing protein [Bacteroidetes bacterium]|nr:MOSC domain-containing protein [Bacteroidota bacterium]